MLGSAQAIAQQRQLAAMQQAEMNSMQAGILSGIQSLYPSSVAPFKTRTEEPESLREELQAVTDEWLKEE